MKILVAFLAAGASAKAVIDQKIDLALEALEDAAHAKKVAELEVKIEALMQHQRVDAPDEMVKAFSKGRFESCAAVREARGCSHPMAAKHCAATCDAAKKLVAGTAVTSADKTSAG